jgi:hypothetical protein
MKTAKNLALALVVAGAHWLAAGQNTAGQNASGSSQASQLDPDTIQPGETTVNRSDSTAATSQPVQNSTAEPADEVRVAPAAAISGRVGFAGTDSGDDTNSELPQIPPLLGGQGMNLAFTGEKERSNYLRGGINVGAAYDDNPLLLPSNAVSNASETVFPNLSIEEATSRTHWTLGYAGGLTVNQRFTNQDQGAQDLTFDSQYRLTQHINLRVAESYLMTTGVFDSGAGGVEQGEAGTLNASLLAPLASQRSSQTTVETNYHYALNDLVGASGSFLDLRFGDLPAGEQLSNQQMAATAGFWLHRFFTGNWGGASYRFERITFDPNGETLVHDFMAVDAMQISKQFSVNGFVGPEYTITQPMGSETGTAASQTNQWSVTAGAAASWQNAKTSLTGGYSRTVTDGAGVLGAVRSQTIHAGLRREFVHAWSADITVNRGTNDSLSVPFAGGISSVNLTSAGGGIERSLGKGLGLHFSYDHDFQQELTTNGSTGPTPAWVNANRNRFAVMFSYQWSKPLGL